MKISIVGIGRVGVAVGFAVTLRKLCRELVLVSRSPEKARAEALDLQHAAALGTSPMRVSGGGEADIAGSDIVVLCASAKIDASKDWTRTAPALANWAMYKEMVPRLVKHAPDAIYVVVANPVDVLTYCTIKAGGLDPKRVIGTGTIIDSARFRSVIARETGVHAADIRAYVLGEHGETQFPANSIATIAGEKADSEQPQWDHFNEAVGSAYTVFSTRGYTNHAIAAAVNHIVVAIGDDACHTLPVSTLIDGAYGVSDVCLSLPCVVGERGIHRVLKPGINEVEEELFRKSAAAVRSVVDQCESQYV